ELQQKLSETEATLSSRQSELEAKKFEAMELAAANRELRQQMERDRTDLGEKQKEFKEQLELIGKTMVQPGTQLLRKENQENITLLLHPLKEKIEAFEKEIQKNQKQDIQQFATMKQMVQSL